jgi:hypothetical protein
VQEHELSLVREYEEKLLAYEEQMATQDLATSTAVSQSLGRLSHSLRLLLRSLGGEDTEVIAQTPSARDRDSDAVGVAVAAAAASEATEWAMGREIELSRLERENESLRRMLGMPGPRGAGDASEEQGLDFSRGVFGIGSGGRMLGGPPPFVNRRTM